MDIILTISLLASNRRDSLKRCLDSLKPLLVKIPTELIIVLTGTDGKVREIAESYTSQIIPFEWCNDFSAARNTGLNMAQGEWFLYIDDDEWFDDVSEICQFFLSGEYQNYCSAHYIQRNYQNWYGTKYSDFSAYRMTHRFPETCFRGAVHEELTPHREPCKYFETCVHHYGYAKETGNRSAGKTSRNIPLLLQAVETRPGQTKNYIQLAKEYDLAGDWKLAEEYCRTGLTVCQDSHSQGWLLAFLTYLVSKNPGKKAAMDEIESILEQKKPLQLIRLVLLQQMIHLCAEAKESEKAVCYGKEFEKLLNEMDEEAAAWEQQSYGEFDENYVKSPEHLYGTRADCAACALEIKDWKAAGDFLKLFPWEEEEILVRYYPRFEEWTEKYGAHFSELLLQVLSEMTGSLGLSDVLETSAYADAPVSVYLLFCKAIDLLEKGEKEQGMNLFLFCVGHTEDSYLHQLCLKEILHYHISVIPLVTQMDLDAFHHLVETVVKESPLSLNSRLLVCEEEIAERYPLHSLCLKKYRLEQKLLKGYPLWDEFIGILEAYCQCIIEFYKGLYQKEWLREENSRFLPEEYRFARIALKGLEALKGEDMTKAVRLFRDVFHIRPEMTGVVTELFRQAANRLDDPMLHAGEEFLQLAAQMKETLRTLTAAGQTAQAEVVLNQLLPLLPEDLELIRCRQEFIRRRSL